MRCLDADALESPTLPRPTYDRTQVRSGIVHIGVGGFHHAHQAAYLDQLINRGRALDWGIAGVGLLPRDRRMSEVMAAQDCLYTLVVKHADGTLQPRVVGPIVQYLFAPDHPEAARPEPRHLGGVPAGRRRGGEECKERVPPAPGKRSTHHEKAVIETGRRQ